MAKKAMKKVFLLLFLILVSQQAMAFDESFYSAFGDVSCITEHGTKICVSPNTAKNAFRTFTQRFYFANTTGADLKDIRFAACFPEPIENNFFDAIVSEETIERARFSLADFKYAVVPSASLNNPFSVTVSESRAARRTVFHGNVSGYLVSGNDLVLSVKQTSFSLQKILKEPKMVFSRELGYCYVSPDVISISSGADASWELRFSTEQKQGKWNLVFFTGTESCVSDDSCIQSWVLDPYWQFDSMSTSFWSADNANWTCVLKEQIGSGSYIAGNSGDYKVAWAYSNGGNIWAQCIQNDLMFSLKDFPLAIRGGQVIGDDTAVWGDWKKTVSKATMAGAGFTSASQIFFQMDVRAVSNLTENYFQFRDGTSIYYLVNHIQSRSAGNWQSGDRLFLVNTVFKLFPDVNIGSFISQQTYAGGGDYNIDFNVHHYLEGMELHLKLGWSDYEHQGQFQNIVSSDINMNATLVADDNLFCDTNAWNATAHCSYKISLDFLPEGNKFWDLNVFTKGENDRNTIVSSDWFITIGTSADIILSGDFSSFGYIKGGTTHNVSFSVYDSDDNASEYLVDVNFSPSCTDGGYSIFNDLNLATDFVHDTNCLGCGSYAAFSKSLSVDANWDFNACMIVQFWDKRENDFYSKTGDYSFLIDSKKPTTSWDGNNSKWQDFDANITLTCHDNNSGCALTRYRLDSDATDAISYGSWQDYTSAGILVSSDGNWAIDFNSTDRAGWVGDTNTFFVLVTNYLEIWKIESYAFSGTLPAFNYLVDGNLSISFKVFDTNNFPLTIDINYSSSATQGTGTVIVDDLNLANAVCGGLAQQWNDSAVTCNWDFNIMNVGDNNYFILIDLNGSVSTFKASSKSFHITTPSIRIQVRDENTGVLLVSPKVSFLGSTYSLDSDGKVSVPSGGATGRQTVSVWEDNNYSSRYFDFDINSLMGTIDLNVFLLRDVNGQDVSFKFYDTDQTTILANKLVRLRHDNNICEMRYTNASGETSFFVNPDDNYVFEIVKSGTNVLQYYPTILTVQIPKDEATLADITPFDAVATGLGNMSWLNTSDTANYMILSNTTSYYVFDINASGYYPRTYSISTKGNPATYSLQPYLTQVIGGLLVKFTVRNNASSAGIANILIESKKSIFGSITTVESAVTDSAGETFLSFVSGETYYLYFYQNGVLRYQIELRPTSTDGYQIYLETGTYTMTIPTFLDVDIIFQPDRGMAYILGDGTIDMNQLITANTTSIQSVRVVITNGSTTVYDVTQFGGDGNHSMFFSQDFNVELLNQMASLKVVVTVTMTTGETHVRSQQYSIQEAGSWTGKQLVVMLMDFFPLQFGATRQEQYPALMIIALFITMLVVGIAAVKVTTDMSGLMFLALAVLGLFVWLQWMPLGVYALACMGGFAMYILSRRLF